MNIHHWIGIGVLSLTLAGGGASAADLQRWRPAPQGMPAMPMPPAVPAPPAPPAMRLGMRDPRFRPVRAGRLRMPPQPPMPYPGRPFVSVQGQSMPQTPPAFVRQYEWRPADAAVDSRRSERPRDVYVAREPYPMRPRMMVPQTPYMPYTPYAGLMPYPPMPPGLMPPPMPYPPFPSAMPGAYPGGPYLGQPGPAMGPFGSPYTMWGVPPYPAPPPPAYYPYQQLPAAPWGSAWPDQAYSVWGGAPTGYPDSRSRFRREGGLGTGFPIAGLY
jgi:hypothetical protein